MNLQRKSFTLVELLVAAGILAFAFGGLLASFVGAQRLVDRAHKRLQSMNISRDQFDELYIHVRADTWDDASNDLYIDPAGGGAQDYPGASMDRPDGTTYTPEYTVEQVTIDGEVMDLRRVQMDVTYEDTPQEEE
ncbi:MAG: hypothetical protein GF333_06225 [Candidatus Omnitrophica bacterium]|nr:hypothetical protein [Candidatus Omnitrophota bacterium]